MWSHGKFYWNELNTHDPETAKRYYADTLGWSYEGMPMPTGVYWIVKVDGEPAGGIFPLVGAEFEGVPDHWFSYVSVDDVDARVAKAKAAGGKLLKDIFDVPGVGRFAIVSDPSGAMMGWITPSQSS